MKNEVNDSENTSIVDNNTDVSSQNVDDFSTGSIPTETPMETSTIVEQPKLEQDLPTVINSSSTNVVAKASKGVGFLGKFTAFGILPIVVAVVVIALVVGGLTVKVVTGTPKAVFTNTINGLYKEVNRAVKDYDKASDKWDIKEKAFLFEGDVKASIPQVEEDFKVGLQIGAYPKKEQVLAGGSVNMEGDNIDVKFLVEDDRIYLSSSILDTPVDITDIASSVFDVEPSAITEVVTLLSSSSDYEVNTKDVEYITKTIKNAFIKTLDSKQMKKTSAKYEVDGKSVSATKISYEIDTATLKNTVKSMAETLLEDDKFLDKLSAIVVDNPIMDNYVSLSSEEAPSKSDIKDAIKDGLREVKSSASDIELEDAIVINLYIKGLTNKVVGFSIEVDDKEYLSYYTNGKNAEFIIDNHVKDSYSSKVKLVVTLTEKKKEQELLVKYNGEKVAEATIRSFEEEKIDFDFKIGSGEETIKGSIYFTKKEKKNEINGEYKISVTVEEEKISVEGNYSFKTLDSLDSFASGAVSVEDVDYDAIRDNIESNIKSEDLAEELNDLVDEAEKKALNLNSYGMREITEKEAIELLNNKKATVLYVGDTYYSSYSNKESYELFYALRSLQNSYDFYSYYLDDYDATKSFFDAVGEITYSCYTELESDDIEEEKQNEEQDNNLVFDDVMNESVNLCKQVPVIYLIKDGKVIKGLRAGITLEDLEKELNAIGIK